MLTSAQSEVRANIPSRHNIPHRTGGVRFSFPGVYIFWASGGKPLYIGSSAKVTKRAYSFGNPRGRNKARKELRSIELFRCDSLAQAQHLEAELIGLYKPKYNQSSTQLHTKTFLQLQAEHEKVFGGRLL